MFESITTVRLEVFFSHPLWRGCDIEYHENNNFLFQASARVLGAQKSNASVRFFRCLSSLSLLSLVFFVVVVVVAVVVIVVVNVVDDVAVDVDVVVVVVVVVVVAAFHLFLFLSRTTRLLSANFNTKHLWMIWIHTGRALNGGDKLHWRHLKAFFSRPKKPHKALLDKGDWNKFNGAATLDSKGKNSRITIETLMTKHFFSVHLVNFKQTCHKEPLVKTEFKCVRTKGYVLTHQTVVK